MNVTAAPVVATLGPASTVPELESVGNAPWSVPVTPCWFVKMVVSEPRESVVVSGHPAENEAVTLTFPQTCELKFAAASDRSADIQGCLAQNLRTYLVCLIAIL